MLLYCVNVYCSIIKKRENNLIIFPFLILSSWVHFHIFVVNLLCLSCCLIYLPCQFEYILTYLMHSRHINQFSSVIRSMILVMLSSMKANHWYALICKCCVV